MYLFLANLFAFFALLLLEEGKRFLDVPESRP
jgi:hypothetical protein